MGDWSSVLIGDYEQTLRCADLRMRGWERGANERLEAGEALLAQEGFKEAIEYERTEKHR